MTTSFRLRDDLLTGAPAIADYVGWSVPRIYYSARRGLLPIKSVGGTLISRKSELNCALSGSPAAPKEAAHPNTEVGP
jgi:hypothetical protein